MILRRIRVADWRCFLDAVELGPFDEGLNIIHAPNGSGKTTLFEALRRALLDGHRVSGRDVEMLRPWGRALAPKVTIEFSHAGIEYRIAKQYLDNPSAMLERMEEGRYRRLAEGVAADEQTRSLLTQNPPGRGLARQENWGLAQILWAPQGTLVLNNLSGDLVADIRSMLSAQVGGAGAGPIEKRIEERYLEFFSPKGKLKTGKDAPLLSRLQDELKGANETRRKALEAYIAFDESTRRVEDLRARRAQARRDAEEHTQLISKARERAESYNTLLAEQKQRAARLSAAEAQYSELKQRIAIIEETTADLSEARINLGKLEEEVPLRLREKLEREKEAARAKGALEDARKGRQSVEQADQLAEAARRFVECEKSSSELTALIEKIQEAEKTLAARKRARSALLAPDSKTLRGTRKAIKERDEAQVRIEASLITLEIVMEKDGHLDVVAAERTGSQPLRSGAPTRVQGSPEVVADLRGIARLRAWGPTGSIEEHREAKAKAEKKIADLTEPFGTPDPEALDALSDKARVLEEGIAETETQLATLLSERTVEDLTVEQSALKAALCKILEQHPDWEQSPPDLPEFKSKAQQIKQAFISTVEGAEEAWELAQSALTAAAGQEETAARRMEDARKLGATLETKWDQLTSDGKQPEERQKELEKLAIAWEAAQARLKEIENQLAGFGVDPAAELDRMEAQLLAANEAANSAREQEVREEAKLEGLAAQGPYSALASIEERVAQLERDVRAEQLHVDAVKLLRDTLATCRAEAVAAVTGPVEAAATRIFQRIASPRLGRIQIGENFEPAAIVPDVAGEPVTLDNLSGGEQEQLYLAARLALAHALRKDERQLVVLDDVLTATDAGRLARVMSVLEEAAQELQILILTCHPERYRSLRTGKFFDLEDALNH